MIGSSRPLWFTGTAFALTYAAAWEAHAWYSVYVLDSWDGKFTDRLGNIRFLSEILPFFLAVALGSHLVAASRQRGWLRYVSRPALAGLGVVAALVERLTWYGFTAGTRSADPRSPWIRAFVMAWVAFGPAAATLAVIFIAKWRARARGSAAAV